MSSRKNLTQVPHRPGQSRLREPRTARVVQSKPHAMPLTHVVPPVYRPLPGPQVLLKPSALHSEPTLSTFPAPAALKYVDVAIRKVSTPSTGAHVAFAQPQAAPIQMHAKRGVAPAGRAATPAIQHEL